MNLNIRFRFGIFDAVSRYGIFWQEQIANGTEVLVVYDYTPKRCPSDFNDDGFVNGEDFDGYVAQFALGEAAADFDGDGFVTGDDFDAFIRAFESGC